jgi:hypothetical protein
MGMGMGTDTIKVVDADTKEMDEALLEDMDDFLVNHEESPFQLEGDTIEAVETEPMEPMEPMETSQPMVEPEEKPLSVYQRLIKVLNSIRLVKPETIKLVVVGLTLLVSLSILTTLSTLIRVIPLLSDLCMLIGFAWLLFNVVPVAKRAENKAKLNNLLSLIGISLPNK